MPAGRPLPADPPRGRVCLRSGGPVWPLRAGVAGVPGAGCQGGSRWQPDGRPQHDVWAKAVGRRGLLAPVLPSVQAPRGVWLSGGAALGYSFSHPAPASTPRLCQGTKAACRGGVCGDDSASQTSPRWPGKAGCVRGLAKHPLFTLQGAVPSFSRSGARKNSPAASRLLLITHAGSRTPPKQAPC